MPRPPKHGKGPAGRIAPLLSYLSEHGGTADSSDIRAGIPSYHGDAGHRQWRRDLKELRERGILRPHDPAEPQSQTVTLAPLGKPKDMLLSRQEHRALQRARTALPWPTPVLAPMPSDARLDVRRLYLLVRYLEERAGQSIPYAQATKELGFTEPELTDLLRQVVEDDVSFEQSPTRHRALDWIDYLPPDQEDPTGYVLYVEPAEAAGALADPIWDTGRGTGQLGRFAYNREETLERLSLIQRAKTSAHFTEADLAQLVSAASSCVSGCITSTASDGSARLSYPPSDTGSLPT